MEVTGYGRAAPEHPSPAPEPEIARGSTSESLRTGHYHTVDDPYLLNEDDARCNGVTQNRHFQDRLLARAHSNSSGSLLGHHLRGVLQGHAGTQS